MLFGLQLRRTPEMQQIDLCLFSLWQEIESRIQQTPAYMWACPRSSWRARSRRVLRIVFATHVKFRMPFSAKNSFVCTIRNASHTNHLTRSTVVLPRHMAELIPLSYHFGASFSPKTTTHGMHVIPPYQWGDACSAKLAQLPIFVGRFGFSRTVLYSFTFGNA